MADSIVYERSFRIPKGVTESSLRPLPAGVTTDSMDVEVTRDNWPQAGCTLYLIASFDGGNTTEIVAGPLLVKPYVVDPKLPAGTITPARIGFSWSPDREPTHVAGGIDAPSAFNARVRVISPE